MVQSCPETEIAASDAPDLFPLHVGAVQGCTASAVPGIIPRLG